MPETPLDCLIAFGANLGEPARTLDRVLVELSRRGFDHLQASDLFSTRPIGGPSGQAPYRNAVIRGQTRRPANQILTALLETESLCGRQRAERWGPRRADLDLLLLGRERIHTGQLEIPHPRMSVRRFVLEPALQIAPEMVHPEKDITLADLVFAIRSARPRTAVWLVDNTPQAIEILSAIRREGWPIDWSESFADLSEKVAVRKIPGEPPGSWHILLQDQPLQLTGLPWRPGLVLTHSRDPDDRNPRLDAVRGFPGAGLVVPGPADVVSFELRGALSAVEEFWTDL